jgi:membrane associated rhomboid family serine protease
LIPLRDLRTPRTYPIVTRLLLGINIAAWVYALYLSRTPGALEQLYAAYAFSPEELRERLMGLVAFPGNWGIETPLYFVTLFTHMFLHGGWLHLLGNMLYLWIFGDNVEDALGSGAYLLFYIACGVIAALGQAIFSTAPLVGASGAICGVLGAYFILFPGGRIATLIFLGVFITVIELPALIVIGVFILVQIIEALADVRLAVPAAQGIAYFAHVFGFLAGVLLVRVARRQSTMRRARIGWG